MWNLNPKPCLVPGAEGFGVEEVLIRDSGDLNLDPGPLGRTCEVEVERVFHRSRVLHRGVGFKVFGRVCERLGCWEA